MSSLFVPLNMLTRQGWLATPVGQGWRLSHQKTQDVVSLYTTSNWFCLARSLPSLASIHCNSDEEWARFYRQLLVYNGQFFMPKLSLDDDGAPLLMMEVPGKEASQVLLEHALHALTHYPSKISISADGSEAPQAPSLKAEAKSQQVPPPGIPGEVILRFLRGVEFDNWGPAGYFRDKEAWRLRYHGHVRKTFEACLTVTRTWVCLEIPLTDDPAAVLKADAQLQLLFLEYLLHLNYGLFMAKFGLSQEGQVLLLLEVPTDALDFALFRLVIRTLTTYLERYGQEILVMASLNQDKGLANLLLPRRAESVPTRSP